MKPMCLPVMAIAGLLIVGGASRAEAGSDRRELSALQKKQTVVLDLASEAQPKLRLKRGECYRMRIRLEEGSRWPTGYLRFRFRSARRDPWTTDLGRTAKGNEIILEMDCFPDTSNYTFTIELADSDGERGTGAAIADLYARKARPGELEATVRGPDPKEIEAQAESRKREYCAKCREENFYDQDAFETCAAIRYDRRACY